MGVIRSLDSESRRTSPIFDFRIRKIEQSYNLEFVIFDFRPRRSKNLLYIRSSTPKFNKLVKQPETKNGGRPADKSIVSGVL